MDNNTLRIVEPQHHYRTFWKGQSMKKHTQFRSLRVSPVDVSENTLHINIQVPESFRMQTNPFERSFSEVPAGDVSVPENDSHSNGTVDHEQINIEEIQAPQSSLSPVNTIECAERKPRLFLPQVDHPSSSLDHIRDASQSDRYQEDISFREIQAVPQICDEQADKEAE